MDGYENVISMDTRLKMCGKYLKKAKLNKVDKPFGWTASHIKVYSSILDGISQLEWYLTQDD